MNKGKFYYNIFFESIRFSKILQVDHAEGLGMGYIEFRSDIPPPPTCQPKLLNTNQMNLLMMIVIKKKCHIKI